MLPLKSWAAGWVWVVARVPTSCRGWKRVEAKSWELTLSFLQRLQSPSRCHSVLGTLVLRADTWQVQFPVMNLLQAYCYPHWELPHHCSYALIGINNYYSAPDPAFPGLTLVSFSDLNSLIGVFFKESFPQKVHCCLLPGLLWILVLVPFFQFPPHCMPGF